MPRYHNINGNKVQFTAEEDAARDAEESMSRCSPAKLANLRLKKIASC